MEIDSIGALLNYVADTMANIANETLQIKQTPASTSAFAKFPKHIGPAAKGTKGKAPVVEPLICPEPPA